MAGREQVRTLLQNIQPKDLLDIFHYYLEDCKLKIAVKWHARPDKVVEVTFSVKNKLIKAMGATKSEALAEAARTFLEGLLGSESDIAQLKQCIKRSNQGNLAPPNVVAKAPLSEQKVEQPLNRTAAGSIQSTKIRFPNKLFKSVSINQHEQPAEDAGNAEVRMLREQLNQAQTCLGELSEKLNSVLLQGLKAGKKEGEASKHPKQNVRAPRKLSMGTCIKAATTSNSSKRDTPTFLSVCNSRENSLEKTTPAVSSKVPRLRLEILPNYHGKSNESLNQSLLDSYNKHHHMRN